jgi:hypothetical protein
MELRAALDRGETLRFRGPVEAGPAALRGILLLAFLLPPALATLVYALRRLSESQSSFSGGVALVGFAWISIMLGILLRSTAWSCGWVELGPEGLALRGAGPPKRWRWDELKAVDGLRVSPRQGAGVPLDPRLGNLLFLESLGRRRL